MMLVNKVIITTLQKLQKMYESVQLTETNHKEFLNHFPAVDIPVKQYSLEADIVTGWKPKNRVLGPIPLNFDSKLLDEIVDELTSFGSRHRQRIIYLGFRFNSSFKMHQEMVRSYSFKYESSINSNYQHMAAYFRKFHANFKSKYNRIFKGMNPTLKPSQQLIFDSNFQSGNLDTVIKVGENQYDLFVRIDTNTRGHLQWFNFIVKNCGKKKIRFNIVNFRKAKTLYQRGMKPYIYSEHLKQAKDLDWFQGGQNVKYFRRKFTYQFLSDFYDEDDITFNCLQFDYTFDIDWEEVQFAYSPPFTYSDLTKMIINLKQNQKAKLQPRQCSSIKEDVLCQSLGGLQIPLLTITDPDSDQKKKRVILISGRIHPGESCGSFMCKGILEFICGQTQEALFLRKNVIFKIIPMLNPDGVIVGNFRTSLCGRDLNRTFKMNNDFLIPQVKALKELVVKLKNQYKSRLIFFLDLHGHSVKKNVFLYGPEYDIWETNYYKTRIFPKLISNKTDMFRYYSCLFRVAQFKKATARAVILRNIPHCYTIEASTGFYYDSIEKKDVPFTPQKWMLMGQHIAESLKQYVDMLNQQTVSKQQRKQRLISLKNMKNTRVQSKKNSQKISVNKFQTRIITNSSQKSKNTEDIQDKKQEDVILSKKARDLIQSIKQDEKKFQEERNIEGHQSDQFSQGGSDSESAGEDLSEEQLKSFQDDIFAYMQEYREKFYRQKGDRQFSMKQPSKRKAKDFEESKPKKEPKGIELIASLRKKAQQLQKTRQVLVWNRIKEQFKEVKNKNMDDYNPRNTLSRIQGIQPKGAKIKLRRGIESELMQKQQLMVGLRESRPSK